VRDIRCRKYVLPQKEDRSSPENRYKIFCTLHYFGARRGPLGPKFTDVGADIEQGPLQGAKFHPVL